MNYKIASKFDHKNVIEFEPKLLKNRTLKDIIRGVLKDAVPNMPQEQIIGVLAALDKYRPNFKCTLCDTSVKDISAYVVMRSNVIRIIVYNYAVPLNTEMMNDKEK